MLVPLEPSDLKTRRPLKPRHWNQTLARLAKWSYSAFMSGIQTVAPNYKLHFRYIAAYLAEGLQCPAGGPILLFSDAAQRRKVLLTDYSHENLQHIDIKVTIANLFSMRRSLGKQ
jgi:hypothetical protein